MGDSDLSSEKEDEEMVPCTEMATMQEHSNELALVLSGNKDAQSAQPAHNPLRE